MAEKFSKAEVDYSKGKPNAHCGICEHYLGSGKCEIVAGEIRPQMWCKHFKRDSIAADVRKAIG